MVYHLKPQLGVAILYYKINFSNIRFLVLAKKSIIDCGKFLLIYFFHKVYRLFGTIVLFLKKRNNCFSFTANCRHYIPRNTLLNFLPF